jgi:hypothetical protein
MGCAPRTARSRDVHHRDEWVARCRTRRRLGFDVDAEDRAEHVGVLRVGERVAGAPAVAEPVPEHAVGTEVDGAAVVVRRRLVERQEGAPAREDGCVTGHDQYVETAVAVCIRVAEVEAGAVRREGDSQQTAFAVARHVVADVDDRVAEGTGVEVERAHATGAFGDVDLGGSGARRHRDGRLGSGDRLEAHLHVGRRRASSSGRRDPIAAGRARAGTRATAQAPSPCDVVRRRL